jgi:small-conductance mechanosensitive channel
MTTSKLGLLPADRCFPAQATHRLTSGQSSALRRIIVTCGLVCIVSSLALAQAHRDNASGSQEATDAIAIENAGAPVEVDGRSVLVVYAQIAGLTPQERAEAIHQRIVALGKRRDIALEAIHAEDRGTWTEILAGAERIMGITEADAKAAERTRPELAAEYTEVIRYVVKQYREDHTWRRVLWGTLYAVLATLGFAGVLVVLFLIRRRARSRVDKWLGQVETEAPVQSVGPRLRRYLGQPLLVLSRAAFWIFVLALVQAYGTLVLRFFPSTKYTSYQITNWLFSELAGFGKVVIAYIPNLILVAFICLATSYLMKLNEYIFGEIRDQKVAIRGFYPDWAEPTAKLVRVLIMAAGAIVAFPYLPGSDSPAFKGISVFLGVLLSLGSTSAVAHGVAGTILTYMRAFQIGDFVRIGDDVGEVVEKTLLVTRIRTQKNEIVTIPNGTVLGGVVVNYSGEARNKGVIFHTTVTIGYNAAWRQVHELLISAALATDGVLHDPPPFVLQTALNDFYVAYELNAYTAEPKNMQNIYSVLHQNIQDMFNEAGVEINSPHYTSLRDGNQTTIPENYLPDNYKSPVFEIQETNGSETARNKVKAITSP